MAREGKDHSLIEQSRQRYRPPLANFSDQIASWDKNTVKKNLVKLLLAGYLLEWSYGNARTLHIYQKIRHPLVWSIAPTRATKKKTPICNVRKTGPYLRTIHQKPLSSLRIAHRFAPKRERGEVASRPWLRKTLAPDLIAREYRTKKSISLIFSTVRNQNRPNHRYPEQSEDLWCTDPT
jgi:hypothetical protein